MEFVAQHFTYKKLLKSTYPTVIMMIFTSFYGVVDGFFVSNFTGKTAFASVNFILPFLLFLSGTGFMFGNGGSALISKTLGEGDRKKADRIFSSLIAVSLAVGILLSLAGKLSLRSVALFMGAEGQLLEDCMIYGSIYLLGIPFSLVQGEFENLYVSAGKPKLGLCITVASGLLNIVLDFFFVFVFGLGLKGAAFATVLSQALGGLFPLIYFSRENKSPLRLIITPVDLRSVANICYNGFSELINNISYSVVGMVYNFQLLRYAGDEAVAAYGVLMYISFLFSSIFIGYVVGAMPLVSYQYGKKNKGEIRNLLRKSLTLIAICSFIMFMLSEMTASYISSAFVGYDGELCIMTLRGFRIFSFSFLFSGFAIFSSSFFTALNNGAVSSFISFVRTLVFQIGLVFILPLILNLDGIWLSCPLTEFLSLSLGIYFIYRRRDYYI